MEINDLWRLVLLGGISLIGVCLIFIWFATKKSILLYYFFLIGCFAIHSGYFSDWMGDGIKFSYWSVSTAICASFSGLWFTYHFFDVEHLPFPRWVRSFHILKLVLLFFLVSSLSNTLILKDIDLLNFSANVAALLALVVSSFVLAFCIFLRANNHSVRSFVLATGPLILACIIFVVIWKFSDSMPSYIVINAANAVLVGLLIQISIFSFSMAFSYRKMEMKKVLAEEQHRKVERENKKILLQNSDLINANKQHKQMIAGLMHDLRTPISNLVGLSSLLEMDKIDDSTKQAFIGQIKEDIDRTNENIERMFDWVRGQLEGYQVQAVNFRIKEVVNEVVEELRLSLNEKNIVLLNQVGRLEINFDRHMFQVIMFNLLTNAIKYSHEHGEVIIGSDIDAEGKKSVWVKDQGVGMTQETLKKIHTENRIVSQKGTFNEKGFGFGLMMVKDFVKNNGAKLFCESEAEKGTKFTIQLAG